MYHYKPPMSCHWAIPHLLLRHFWKTGSLLSNQGNHQKVLIPNSHPTTLCASVSLSFKWGDNTAMFVYVKIFEALGQQVLREEQELNPLASPSMITAVYFPSLRPAAFRTKGHLKNSCFYSAKIIRSGNSVLFLLLPLPLWRTQGFTSLLIPQNWDTTFNHNDIYPCLPPPNHQPLIHSTAGNTSTLTPWSIKDNPRNLTMQSWAHQFLYASSLPMCNDWKMGLTLKSSRTCHGKRVKSKISILRQVLKVLAFTASSTWDTKSSLH